MAAICESITHACPRVHGYRMDVIKFSRLLAEKSKVWPINKDPVSNGAYYYYHYHTYIYSICAGPNRTRFVVTHNRRTQAKYICIYVYTNVYLYYNVFYPSESYLPWQMEGCTPPLLLVLRRVVYPYQSTCTWVLLRNYNSFECTVQSERTREKKGGGGNLLLFLFFPTDSSDAYKLACFCTPTIVTHRARSP